MVNLLHSPLLRFLTFFFVGFILFPGNSFAQSVPIEQQKFIYFPHATTKKTTASIGVSATTLPYDITEEFHYRVPALDVHILQKLSKDWGLDLNLTIQVLQNQVKFGPKWSKQLNNRFSMAIGNEVGFWFGSVNFAGFKSRASGFQNFPFVAVGYRFNKQVLLSLRAEAMMDYNINTYAGNQKVITDYRLFSGSSYMVALEQPFYGKKNLLLGFRAMYTNFFWQTWPAFENFDRNIFFPQLVIGLIL